MALNLKGLFDNGTSSAPQSSRGKFSGLRADPTYTLILIDYADQVVQGCEIMADMLKILDAVREKSGLMPRLNISLISDGEDTASRRASDNEVRSLIMTLKKKEYLKRAVVLGLLDDAFTEEKLENIRKTIGFDKYITLDKSAKEIRRAFLEASKIN